MTITKVGIRVANLALINMISLFFGIYLSFLANRFIISLKTFRIIHRLVDMMSFVFVLFHILVVVVHGAGTFFLSVLNFFRCTYFFLFLVRGIFLVVEFLEILNCP